MTSLDPRAVLQTLNERAMMPRVGLSIMREMDRDIVAMRDAAQVIAGLLDTQERVGMVIAEHERREVHNESVPLNRLSDLLIEPTSAEYRLALEGENPMDQADLEQEERDATFGPFDD